jgi:hypothetical protein
MSSSKIRGSDEWFLVGLRRRSWRKIYWALVTRLSSRFHLQSNDSPTKALSILALVSIASACTYSWPLREVNTLKWALLKERELTGQQFAYTPSLTPTAALIKKQNGITPAINAHSHPLPAQLQREIRERGTSFAGTTRIGFLKL